MAEQELALKITLDDQGVVTKFEQLGAAQEDVKSKSEGVNKTFSGLERTIVVLNQGLELAGKAFRSISGAIDDLGDIALLGDQVNDVSSAFNDLSIKAGLVGDTFLNNLQNATQGAVNNLDLMKAANDSLIAGLSPEQFTKVAQAAKQYGDQLGKDTNTAINELSNAVQTGNEKILKSYGIYSDGKELVKQYTKAASDAGKQIDAETISQIKQGAALDALNKVFIENKDVQFGVGDQVDRIKTSYANLNQQFSAAFDNSSDLSKVLGDVKKSMDGIDAKKLGEALATIVSLFSDLAKSILPSVVSNLNDFARGIETLFGKSKQADIDRLRVRIVDLNEEIKAVQSNAYNNTWADKLFGTDKKTQVEALNSELDVTQRTLQRLEGEMQAAQAESTKHTVAIQGTSEAGKTLERTLAELGDTTKSTKDNIGLLKQSTEVLTDELYNLEKAAKSANFNLGDYVFGKNKAKKDPQDFISSLLGLPDFSKLNNQNAFQSIANNLSQAFASAFSSIQDGKINQSDLGPLANTAGTLIGTGIGAAIGGPLGAAVGGSIGSAIANAAVTIGELAHQLFDNETAGTKARKEADKFFADIFDKNRLQVIIDGQLKEIRDLVFGGKSGIFGDGTFDDAFQSLSDAARAGFDGVGQAFEQLLGVTDDIAGQIGAVFVNNIGGSLNNLQLLVKRTGKSFEELQDAIVTSFENGNLSFIQAQTALQGIAQVAQKGIPDAIGATIQAVKNLEAAGVKGGLAAADALGDIGAEAKELSLKDFPALIKNLTASGEFSADTINKIFDALQANGISTIDQLVNATSKDLIPVLSQLQQSAFPFAEAANTATDLLSTIEKIPASKDVEINLRVNTYGDVNALNNAVAAQEQTGGGKGIGFGATA